MAGTGQRAGAGFDIGTGFDFTLTGNTGRGRLEKLLRNIVCRVEVADEPVYALPTMKVSKLLHTRFRVNDLEGTVRFYKEVLGLEELRRHKSPRGSELVFLKAPESEEEIELCCFPSSGQVSVPPDLTHLAFQVDRLDEFGKHLAKFGLKFSDGPTTTSTGTVFAFIDAPEGFEIELIQRAK